MLPTYVGTTPQKVRTKMIKTLRWIGKVLKRACEIVVKQVKELFQNSAAVAVLVGATIGFTKLAVELPFYVELPLWIEATMVAPVIGLVTVIALLQVMKLQLKWQGVYQ